MEQPWLLSRPTPTAPISPTPTHQSGCVADLMVGLHVQNALLTP